MTKRSSGHAMNVNDVKEEKIVMCLILVESIKINTGSVYPTPRSGERDEARVDQVQSDPMNFVLVDCTPTQ